MGLREDLIDIQETLRDYFNNSNESSPIIRTKDDNQSEIHHHYHHGYAIPSFPLYPQPVIINNNSSPGYHTTKHDKDEEEDKKKSKPTRGEIVAGMVLIGGIGAAATYILSQDEYIKFYLSKIDEKIKALKQYQTDRKEGPDNREITSIIENYDSWKTLHETRTLNKCGAKVIGTGSCVSAISGFILYNNLILFTGLAGGITCGCYLLWRYLTDNLRKERQYYEQMIKSVTKIVKNIDTLPKYDAVVSDPRTYISPIPSAPLAPSDDKI